MHTHIAENSQLQFRPLSGLNFPIRLFAVLDFNTFDGVKRAFGRLYLVFVLLSIAEHVDLHEQIVSRPIISSSWIPAFVLGKPVRGRGAAAKGGGGLLP